MISENKCLPQKKKFCSFIYGVRPLWGTITAAFLGTDEILTFLSLGWPWLPLCLYVNISSNKFVLLFLCLHNPFQNHYDQYSALLAVWQGRYYITQKSPFHNIHWKFRNCVIRWVWAIKCWKQCMCRYSAFFPAHI